MVPIHDTDLAEERFNQAEWDNYELWEKVEVRLRRRKWVWICGVALLFFALSSVPTLLERAPKWRAMSATRRLAEKVGWLKRQAAIEHRAYRIRFMEADGAEYVIEKSPHCNELAWAFVASGSLIAPRFAEGYRVLSPEQGQKLGVPGLLQSICYDALNGAGVDPVSGVSGIGVIPVKDLAEGRSDRLSILFIGGASANLSFD
jgi:hypothetical protein